MLKYLLLYTIAAASVAGSGLPFYPERGLVEVDVVIDGRVKGRFGIDTGADFLYIDRNFAFKNNLNVVNQPRRPVTGVEGQAHAVSVSVGSLKIGEVELTNIQGTAVDLSTFIKDESDGLPDGFIGYSVLKNFFVTVDYPNHLITISEDKPDILNTSNYIAMPFEQYKHLILVEVLLEKNVKTKMILDYCASYTSVSEKVASLLSFRRNDNQTMRGVASQISLSDKVTSERVEVAVQDFMLLKKSLPRAEFEGTLGSTFLNQFKVTVDYKNKQLYFHKR